MKATTKWSEEPVAASPVASAQRDLVTGGIVVAAILMFVGSGGTIAHSVLNLFAGIGGGIDRLLASTLLLNIALILRLVDRLSADRPPRE